MNWFRRKKQRPAAAGPKSVIGSAAALREFVYLDEVSVYSLTSAPDLPPPVTMSESASDTLGATITSQLEVGGPVIAKAGMGSELNTSRTGGMEVQRQFNIQSQFARLHRTYRPTFLLTANADVPRDPDTTTDLNEALEALQADGGAVREADIARGSLAEMRVTLRPHPMFDISAFTKTVGNLIEKYPGLLGLRDDMPQVQTGLQAGEFFAELMEDLIPIEGRATSHRVVTDDDGNRWVADTGALTAAVVGRTFISEPLRVVGVAEIEAFWKDTRRILHSDSDFDILGRVARSGLHADWTPIKIIDTFKRVVPTAADDFLGAVENLRNITRDDPVEVGRSKRSLVAGLSFMQALAEHHGVPPVSPSPTTTTKLTDASDELREVLAALNDVADEFYARHSTVTRNADEVALLRQDAWRSALALVTLPADVPALLPEPVHPAVEFEFVAMYW